MNDRTRLYLYIIAGGYLAYTGYGLIKNVMEERPDHSFLYMAIGAVFIVIGGFFAVKSIIKMTKGDDNDKTEGE